VYTQRDYSSALQHQSMGTSNRNEHTLFELIRK